MPLSGSEPFGKRAPEDVWWRQEEIVCEIVCGSEPVEARVVIGMCFLTLTELELMLPPPHSHPPLPLSLPSPAPLLPNRVRSLARLVPRRGAALHKPSTNTLFPRW